MKVPGAENPGGSADGGKLVSHGEDRGGRNILGQGQEILQGGAHSHAVVDEGSSITAILASFVEIRGGWCWLQKVEALSKVANSPPTLMGSWSGWWSTMCATSYARL